MGEVPGHVRVAVPAGAMVMFVRRLVLTHHHWPACAEPACGWQDMRAWHAGVSCWQGREQCNDFSIGIELEGCDDEAYTDAQYDTLNELLAALTKHYPDIRHDAIVGHSDIAPGRKTDPGPAFDWSRVVAGQSQE